MIQPYTSNNKQIALGLDPGLSNTGWAVVEMVANSPQHITSGVLHTATTSTLPARLAYLHAKIMSMLEQYRPNICAIEKTYVNINSGSSLKLAHARGAIMAALGTWDAAVIEYEAKTIKKTIVGNGNADKQQIARMLKIMMPQTTLAENAGDQNDAVAIALCGLLRNGK